MPIDRNMHILVVDDFSTMRRVVNNLLIELGFTHIDEADDGETAWPLIQTGQYDFIVSDLNMPGMSGFELLTHIRNDENLREIPFLLITAEAKRSQFSEAVRLGVDGYIVKPFTAETLNTQIQKIFEHAANR